jgi:hypothetical protein
MKGTAMATRKKAPAAKVDAQWFKLQMARAGYSMRAFAAALGVDPSSMHRTLRGVRKATLPEIQRMASLLDRPVGDVLSHLGLKMDGLETHGPVVLRVARPDGSSAPLVGEVDANGGVVTFHAKAIQGDAAVVALAIRGDAFLTNWRVLCVPSENAPTPATESSTGIVQLKDGRMLLRKIRPGFTRGRFDLGPALGFGGREDDAELVGVIPVIGMEQG